MTDLPDMFHLKDVTYRYEENGPPALQDVSLDIPEGSLVMVIGPSGSGKTTLCNILAGVIPHLIGGELSGEVLINGLDAAKADVNEIVQKVGIVFQDAEVMFSMLEVEDEIAFGPENRGLPPAELKQVIEHSLEFANLTGLRHNLVWELSGGQAQRLGIASVLAMQTPVIIMDEPTANLDPIATRFVHDMAMRLKADGHTVILVTKESDEFLEQADLVIVLDKGRLVCMDSPQVIIDHLGDELSEQLGIWLPEVCEIGLGLRQRGLLNGGRVPLSIGTALRTFESIQFRPAAEPAQAKENQTAQSREEKSVLISARDVHYSYPGSRPAVKGISFDVYRDDFLAIVGRNGAGKSTLSKMLVGLQRPQSGSLTMFGKESHNWTVSELSRKIALVFQNPEHQFLTDTVFDEIAYSFRSKSKGEIDPEELRKSVQRVLQMLDLEDAAQEHPFSLSAGRKRRLGVAAMLVGSPEVLIVDEPTYGQDKKMTASLMGLMSQLRQMGITIIMITHNMRLVQEYAERVIVMNEGLITFNGYPGDLFGNAALLNQASLTVTSLQTLVEQLRARGQMVPPNVKSCTDFLTAVAG